MASPDDLRHWVRSRRAAELREHTEGVGVRREPGESLRAAMSLIALARSKHGWPLPVSPRDEMQDLVAWERWARLRRLLEGGSR